MAAPAPTLSENMAWTAESAGYSAEKMGHLELRAMKGYPLSHEVCRLMMEQFREFDYKGDATWPVRQLRDLATYWVRCFPLFVVPQCFCKKKQNEVHDEHVLGHAERPVPHPHEHSR